MSSSIAARDRRPARAPCCWSRCSSPSTTTDFLDRGNLVNLVLQVSIVAIVAIGSTIVIFTGGIDLSPGSAIALMTVVFASSVKTVGRAACRSPSLAGPR